ncbi:hypothetical protein BGV40_04490 [Methanosarcina sp. Ant1]|nr:hypothetical protein BGV40_04490 [Methanosarcina sp. Ant1]
MWTTEFSSGSWECSPDLLLFSCLIGGDRIDVGKKFKNLYKLRICKINLKLINITLSKADDAFFSRWVIKEFRANGILIVPVNY